jgi:membrane protein
MKRLISHLPNLLKLSYEGWKKDQASRLSAALAYYTIFSLAPMLVIVIAITGLIWEAGAVRGQILHQIQGLVGAQGAQFIDNLISRTGTPGKDVLATIIGIITLLVGALGVFNELHNSLNTIWDVKEEKAKNFLQGLKMMVIDRLLSFTMILGIGFLLMVSLVISAGLTAVQNRIGNLLPFSDVILQLLNLAISIAVITILFAMMFKFLPDAEIAWGDVWLGAFFTAVLFSIGKTVIGVYLGSSSVASAFGAAGSLIVLLLWIYYSAQILFFGAEFTQAYANQLGSKIVAEAEAAKRETKRPQTRRGTGWPQVPDAPVVPVTGGPHQEEEASQFARLLLGTMAASFLSGIAATFYGLRKRK